jgi:hypothetical protein
MAKAPEPHNDEKDAESIGPQKGEFIAPPEMADADEPGDALPQQEEFWRPPHHSSGCR